MYHNNDVMKDESRAGFGVFYRKGRLVKKTKPDRKNKQGQTRVRLRRLPRVPPPDSSVWPEPYRGQRWKPAYAILFAGKCQLCAYSCPLSKWRQGMDQCMGMTRLLLCTNHPRSPGELREVLPIETCRNFKAKSWRPARARPTPDRPAPGAEETDPNVRRIPVGNSLFATVDAAECKRLSKYKWYVMRRGRKTYARCCARGRMVFMHRMIMRPRKGYVVDHIDGNGLNNRRCNLRVCTQRENMANRGPHGGASGFIGVYRKGDKWYGGIKYRGKFYYLGLFDDPVQAAQARDRKAYELHGVHAYLNFPEDYRRKKQKKAKEM
jgi:hypothetical protein